MVTDAPGEVDVVIPSPNTFLAFQGDLLHGVLPTGWSTHGVADGDEWRLTLLVNWWTVVPRAPCCSPLPDEMSQTLQDTHTFAYEPKLEAHDTSAIGTQVDLGEIDCSDRNIDCREIDVLAPPHLGLGSAALQTSSLADAIVAEVGLALSVPGMNGGEPVTSELNRMSVSSRSQITSAGGGCTLPPLLFASQRERCVGLAVGDVSLRSADVRFAACPVGIAQRCVQGAGPRFLLPPLPSTQPSSRHFSALP